MLVHDYSNIASTMTASAYGTTQFYVETNHGTTMVGGNGANLFAFDVNAMGKDVVSGFDTKLDTLGFNKSLFINFAAAMTHASQVGANTVFSVSANDTVTLQNVAMKSLTANNFKFA
jgi:hypothetical protein